MIQVENLIEKFGRNWSNCKVRPMLEIERKAIFKNTFSEKFGLDSDESSEFADYIEHLIDTTTFQPNRKKYNK